MKRISQYLMLTGLSGLLCLFLAVPANAQRGGNHGGGGGHSGGGGGGFHGGGGGGGSHFSGGGGAHFNGGGFSGRSGATFHQQPNGGARFGAGRNPGIQGNTRSFSNRGAVTGSGRNFSNRVGVAGGGYHGAAIAPRGGFYRGGRYYAGGYGHYGFGYRYSPWRSHGGYYFNRGFYGSLYYPRLGFSLGILPFGYYPFYWGDAQFFYSDGYFYQQNNDQYTVVEPPIGAAITTLPDKAQSITINGQQYYELNGVYYLPITKDDGTVVYQVAGKDGHLDTDNGGYDNGNGGNGNGGGNGPAVAAPEIGDIFYNLPPDTRKIKLNGEQYYVSPDDFYYQETRDQSGKKAYKIVGTPDDAPGGN